MTEKNPKEDFIRLQLDPIRRLFKNAEEEYGQYLDEFEREFGTEAREKYEEEHC